MHVWEIMFTGKDASVSQAKQFIKLILIDPKNIQFQ